MVIGCHWYIVSHIDVVLEIKFTTQSKHIISPIEMCILFFFYTIWLILIMLFANNNWFPTQASLKFQVINILLLHLLVRKTYYYIFIYCKPSWIIFLLKNPKDYFIACWLLRFDPDFKSAKKIISFKTICKNNVLPQFFRRLPRVVLHGGGMMGGSKQGRFLVYRSGSFGYPKK